MSKFFYWGPLLYHTEINDVDIKNIRSLCIKDIKNDFRKDLAGHIIEEFLIKIGLYNSLWSQRTPKRCKRST
jgi:hypothetical protein